MDTKLDVEAITLTSQEYEDKKSWWEQRLQEIRNEKEGLQIQFAKYSKTIEDSLSLLITKKQTATNVLKGYIHKPTNSKVETQEQIHKSEHVHKNKR